MAVEPTPNLPAPPLPPRGSGAPWDCGRHHLGQRHHRRGRGIIPGLLVIAWGGLLLLRELGMIDAGLRVLDFWPLLLVGLGLSIAVRGRGLAGVLVGLATALLGAGMLAERLGYVVGGVVHLWPLVVVAAGVGIIWNGMTRRRAPRLESQTDSADELHRTVTMGGLALVVDSQQFKGGALSVTMGEVRVDLRRAALSAEECTLDLAILMGGVELYLPSNWQVVSDVSPFMGVVEDKTAPRPDGTGVQKRLVLRGKITMGAVTITN